MSGSTQNMNNTTSKIIWFALLMSLLIYGAVLFLMEPPEESIDQTISIALFLIGCVNIGLGTFGIDLFMKVESRDQYFTRNIIKWAVIESGVVLGLANGFMGGGKQVFVGLLVLAVLSHRH